MAKSSGKAADEAQLVVARASSWSDLWKTEDWWAIWLGGLLLLVVVLSVLAVRPSGAGSEDGAAGGAAVKKLSSPLKAWVVKPHGWTSNPLTALSHPEKGSIHIGLGAVFLATLLLFGASSQVLGVPFPRFAAALIPIFLLATLAYVLSEQKVIKDYNLEYVLWALLIGLIISNTIGTPAWWKPAIRTEFFIKTGLVLLGAEVLFSELLALGVPGICVSWVVTPIVLIGTYMFGQRVLKMESRTLNLVISADMSVCGVSAAIATASACRAKKEELSLAIGLSLAFTVVMMIVQPAFIKAVGMDPAVGGAWLGGTIDSTGAVVAAGELLPAPAKTVAATVKMIQNILIGVISFAVAVYWVSRVERDPQGPKPSLWEIWHRFPKFILGFIAASLVFSLLHGLLSDGKAVTTAALDVTKSMRGWLFCLAFISIGLETNFRQLAHYLRGGKPMVLYVCGQALNLLLTFIMAWLMFGVLYGKAAQQLAK